MTVRKRVRVLQVIPTLNCGGGERICAEIACGLDASRFEAYVVSLGPLTGTRLEHQLRDAGIPVDSLGKRPGPDFRLYRRFHAILNCSKPDILHTHLHVLPYVCVSARIRKMPCVHTVHNMAEKEATGMVRIFNRLAFRMGTVPVGISAIACRSIERVYPVTNVPLIANGIDTRPYREERHVRAEWRARNGYSEGDRIIVSVGRLAPQKNFPLLLSAFAELSRIDRGLKLIIAGEGPSRHQLEARVEELHLVDRVLLAGERNDVPDILMSSDLYVATSLWEGHPLSVIEAMAAGLAVVVSGVGGVPDLVNDGITGILLPPNNLEALVNSIRDVIGRPELRRCLGQSARGMVIGTLDVSTMVRSYEDLYLRLLTAARIESC